MIAYLRGTLISKSDSNCVIEASGVGYEIYITRITSANLPGPGHEAKLLISESIGMYGGTTLYGFLQSEEKQLFELFKDAVPNTGAKKAIEYLGKALKSLPDFQKAIAGNDTGLLTGIFGFTKKTASRLVSGLKDKMPGFAVEGISRISPVIGGSSREGGFESYRQVLNALASLGYKFVESRAAIQSIQDEGVKPDESIEDMLRRCLSRLAS